MAAGHCRLDEAKLIGSWRNVDGTGFFEEFELSIRGGARSFSSWLHARPDIIDASWELHDCELVIRNRDSEMTPFVYRASMMRHHLLLRDVADKTTAAYARASNDP